VCTKPGYINCEFPLLDLIHNPFSDGALILALKLAIRVTGSRSVQDAGVCISTVGSTYARGLFPDVRCLTTTRFCASVDIQYCHHLLNSSFLLAICTIILLLFLPRSRSTTQRSPRELSQPLVIWETSAREFSVLVRCGVPRRLWALLSNRRGDHHHRLQSVDRLDFHAYGWAGEPCETH
jgi:hypothetical protein